MLDYQWVNLFIYPFFFVTSPFESTGIPLAFPSQGCSNVQHQTPCLLVVSAAPLVANGTQRPAAQLGETGETAKANVAICFVVLHKYTWLVVYLPT